MRYRESLPRFVLLSLGDSTRSRSLSRGNHPETVIFPSLSRHHYYDLDNWLFMRLKCRLLY